MNEIIQNNLFGWKETDRYTILDLGTMTKAIVIKKEEVGSLFLISLRSYFSFPDSFYNERFETKEKAKEYACKYLLEWVGELNKQLFSNN